MIPHSLPNTDLIIQHSLQQFYPMTDEGSAAATSFNGMISVSRNTIHEFAKQCKDYSSSITDCLSFQNSAPSSNASLENDELVKKIGKFLNENIHLIKSLSPSQMSDEYAIQHETTEQLLQIKRKIQECDSKYKEKLIHLLDKFLYTQESPLAKFSPVYPRTTEAGININILFGSLSNNSVGEIANSMRLIRECPNIVDEERYELIAKWINNTKMPLAILALQPAEIVGIAPHLEYLDCENLFEKNISNEELSVHLSRYPKLTTLIIKQLTHVTSLPPMEKLLTLDCSNCTRLTQLPELPIINILKCSFCRALTQLPRLTFVTTLDCTACDQLIQLPELPSVTTLSCSFCLSLIQLPELPFVITLNCMQCSQLTQMPDLPLVIDLNCAVCMSLRQLARLPLVRTLQCYGCSQLGELPDLPLVLNLNCSKCYLLTQIPYLPRVRNLNCSKCYLLTQIPYLPRVRNLNCSSCNVLWRLPELPNIQNLKSNDCPLLE